MNEHAKKIDVAVAEALEQASLKSMDEIDAIAVTKGPGLEICLRVGCRKAQKLSIDYGKPFVTVHHLEAHCFMARMAGEVIVEKEEECDSPQPDSIIDTHLAHFCPKVDFPFLTLLVSGGHTSLMVCRGIGDYEVLGGTLDDGVRESFDKAARLLGLRSAGSGGAAIEAAARLSAEATRAEDVRKKGQRYTPEAGRERWQMRFLKAKRRTLYVNIGVILPLRHVSCLE